MKDSPSPIETDTLEGKCKAIYHQNEMNITVTSTWCSIRKKQVPVMVTILFGKSKEAYDVHWSAFFQHYASNKETIDQFFHEFPGNTSDFSDALRLGFFLQWMTLQCICISVYCVMTRNLKFIDTVKFISSVT